MATVPALELDTETAGYTRSEPVHFGNFPGVWEPGRPIALSELGFASEEEALTVVADLELPLRETTVDLADARMPVRPNHLLSEEQQRALELADAGTAKKRWTHEELNERAASAGVNFPDHVKKVDDKLAFLEAAADGTVTTDGEEV